MDSLDDSNHGCRRSLKVFVKNLVNDSGSVSNKYFEYFVFLLILLSVFCFTIETLPDLPKKHYFILESIEFVVSVLFLVEYCVRLFFSKNRVGYMFSFYGLVDFVSILPLFLSLAFGWQSLKLLRLFRLMKLLRYSGGVARIARAISLAKDELIVFTFSALILLYLAAVGIYHFEHAAQPEVFRSIFDSLWWAVATLTTVGYGDVYPVTVGGRLFTFIVLMIGLGVVAVPTGIISSSLSAVRNNEE